MFSPVFVVFSYETFIFGISTLFICNFILSDGSPFWRYFRSFTLLQRWLFQRRFIGSCFDFSFWDIVFYSVSSFMGVLETSILILYVELSLYLIILVLPVYLFIILLNWLESFCYFRFFKSFNLILIVLQVLSFMSLLLYVLSHFCNFLSWFLCLFILLYFYLHLISFIYFTFYQVVWI